MPAFGPTCLQDLSAGWKDRIDCGRKTVSEKIERHEFVANINSGKCSYGLRQAGTYICNHGPNDPVHNVSKEPQKVTIDPKWQEDYDDAEDCEYNASHWAKDK